MMLSRMIYNHCKKFGPNFSKKFAQEEMYNHTYFDNMYKDIFNQQIDIAVKSATDGKDVEPFVIKQCRQYVTNTLSQQMIMATVNNKKRNKSIWFENVQTQKKYRWLMLVCAHVYMKLYNESILTGLFGLHVSIGPVTMCTKHGKSTTEPSADFNSIDIKSYPVQMVSKKLQTSFEMEVITDLKLLHHMDAEKEVALLLANQVFEELIAELTSIDSKYVKKDEITNISTSLMLHYDNLHDVCGKKYLVNKFTESMITKPYNIVLYTLIPSIVTKEDGRFRHTVLMFRGSVHKVYDWYGPIEQTQVLME